MSTEHCWSNLSNEKPHLLPLHLPQTLHALAWVLQHHVLGTKLSSVPACMWQSEVTLLKHDRYEGTLHSMILYTAMVNNWYEAFSSTNSHTLLAQQA
jgi:hypothetical protein